MSETKKLLIGFNPKKPQRRSSDFLTPISDAAGVCLVGLKTTRRYEQGQMVYIGMAITPSDMLSKMLDSGAEIVSEREALELIDSYFQMLQDFKIGNILGIASSSNDNCGFRLVKVADHEPFERRELP